MSKGQAPAPEGQITHPTKLIVRGYAPGSQGYDDARAAHQADLMHFVATNEQYLAISGQRSHRAQTRVRGATISYTNNEGQATVVLELEPGTKGGDEQSETKEGYWPWAVIELKIPTMTETNTQGVLQQLQADLGAVMHPRPKKKIGAAHDATYRLEDSKPPLVYAYDPATFLGQFSDPAQFSSLLVDLRPYPGGVKFDLYGYIGPYNSGKLGPATVANYDAYETALVTSGPSAYLYDNGIRNSIPLWPSPADIGSRVRTNLRYDQLRVSDVFIKNDFPETIGKTFQQVGHSLPGPDGPYPNFITGPNFANGPSYYNTLELWGAGTTVTGFDTAGVLAAAGGNYTETITPTANPLIYKIRGLGGYSAIERPRGSGNYAMNVDPVAGDDNYTLVLFDYVRYWVGEDHNYLLAYPTRDATVSFAMFEQQPDAYTGDFNGHTYSAKWQVAKQFPKRNKFKDFKDKAHIIGQNHPSPSDQTPENNFLMPKIGTIIINPKRGKGGIKFTPA